MQTHTPKNTIRSVLLVMLFCYLPHLASSPWWLSILIVSAVAYRMLAIPRAQYSYYSYPLPNVWVRLFLIISSLGILLWQYRFPSSSGFYIGFLLAFIALKILEIRTVRDLRILVFCNFYVILTALLIHQELWVFLYVIFAVLANLSMMLKLTAPLVEFRQSGKSLMKHFLLALPVSLLLFYLFPRFISPLWHVPLLTQTKTGFSEEMIVGNLTEIFDDDSTAMRITFKKNFKPSLYWRGLVLSDFDGRRWKPATSSQEQFTALKPIDSGELASYEILLEPHQKKWLFYQDNPIAAYPNLLFLPSEGLVQQDSSLIYQRFSYDIIEAPPVYQNITKASSQLNTYLPKYGNPRLRAWAKQQYTAVNGNIQALIGIIAQHINQQPYWYSLRPGTAKTQVNQMDSFWFDSKRGYCEYYAGSVAIILRAVGIPTRVIVGYHGGKWNPVAQYLTVQQNDAHAWLEYWQEGIGWHLLDPVIYISPQRIDPAIHQKLATEIEQEWFKINANLPWTMHAIYMLESAQFFWERWLLFYNQDTQRALLQKIGLGQWDAMNLLQAFIAVLLLIFVTGGMWYLIRQQRERDPLLIEYHRLQQEMRRLTVQTQPPATFAQQLQELAVKQPHLSELLSTYAHQYEQLQLQHADDKLKNRNSILQLLRSLRRRLRRE